MESGQSVAIITVKLNHFSRYKTGSRADEMYLQVAEASQEADDSSNNTQALRRLDRGKSGATPLKS